MFTTAVHPRLIVLAVVLQASELNMAFVFQKVDSPDLVASPPLPPPPAARGGGRRDRQSQQAYAQQPPHEHAQNGQYNDGYAQQALDGDAGPAGPPFNHGPYAYPPPPQDNPQGPYPPGPPGPSGNGYEPPPGRPPHSWDPNGQGYGPPGPSGYQGEWESQHPQGFPPPAGYGGYHRAPPPAAGAAGGYGYAGPPAGYHHQVIRVCSQEAVGFKPVCACQCCLRLQLDAGGLHLLFLH